jgi:type VI secretion system protein ImpI/type VI secretion system protein
MRLTLSILRCPLSMPPESRHFDGGEISIGRGSESDWVLADPDRHLSKRHFMVAFHGGNWQLADLSTNGTFLNGETHPVGAGIPRRLRNGDRIRLEGYEIEARIERAEPAQEPAWSSAFGGDVFGQPPQTQVPDDYPPAGRGVTLPADFDPFAPDDASEDSRENWQYPTQADHSPSTSDAFRFTPVTTILPDDWADDPVPVPPRSTPAPPPPKARQALRPQDAAPPPEPVRQPDPTPPPATADASGGALMAAFLRGAGLPGTKVDNAEALMEEVGEMMRAMVSGVRQTLIARSAVKSEFRIERTMISARGNNPLKFSADDDDALAALIGSRRRTDMPAPQAVMDALRDMRLHELATVSAMQAAVRALVAKFDPDAIKHDAGTGAFSMQRKARAWDAFELLHAAVAQNLIDDFDSVFGKSFARAYERAQNELAGDKGPFR